MKFEVYERYKIEERWSAWVGICWETKGGRGGGLECRRDAIYEGMHVVFTTSRDKHPSTTCVVDVSLETENTRALKPSTQSQNKAAVEDYGIYSPI